MNRKMARLFKYLVAILIIGGVVFIVSRVIFANKMSSAAQSLENQFHPRGGVDAFVKQQHQAHHHHKRHRSRKRDMRGPGKYGGKVYHKKKRRHRSRKRDMRGPGKYGGKVYHAQPHVPNKMVNLARKNINRRIPKVQPKLKAWQKKYQHLKNIKKRIKAGHKMPKKAPIGRAQKQKGLAKPGMKKKKPLLKKLMTKGKKSKVIRPKTVKKGKWWKGFPWGKKKLKNTKNKKGAHGHKHNLLFTKAPFPFKKYEKMKKKLGKELHGVQKAVFQKLEKELDMHLKANKKPGRGKGKKRSRKMKKKLKRKRNPFHKFIKRFPSVKVKKYACSKAKMKKVLEKECITLMLMADHRRHLPILFKLLHHYKDFDRLHKIIILWTKIGRTKPPSFQRVLKSKVPIVIKEMKRHVETQKYAPFLDIKTKAVLNVEENILVQESDLNAAFNTWKTHQARIIGFQARSADRHKGGTYRYSHCCKHEYNMVSGRAMLYHTDLAKMFQQKLHPRIRFFINKVEDCADLAFNVVVSDQCKCTAGMYMQPNTKLKRVVAKGVGRSHDEEDKQKNQCLNKFAKFYKGKLPLKRYTQRH